MICAWNELLSILPIRLRKEIDLQGKDTLQELRLRINAPPELVFQNGSSWLSETITRDDLRFIINTASKYSPWAASTMANGYITAPGGHRIGICGEAVCRDGKVDGIREVHSVCIRIARDYPGIAETVGNKTGSILILGAPGWGKTTLLRDMIRHLSQAETVCVVDERQELFPPGFLLGKKTDILTGCPKSIGIDMVLRTMGPSWIAVDEITAENDCQALIQASNCGVHLLATAHADSMQAFRSRTVYQPLLDNKVFTTAIILCRDKSYQVERITI